MILGGELRKFQNKRDNVSGRIDCADFIEKPNVILVDLCIALVILNQFFQATSII